MDIETEISNIFFWELDEIENTFQELATLKS